MVHHSGLAAAIELQNDSSEQAKPFRRILRLAPNLTDAQLEKEVEKLLWCADGSTSVSSVPHLWVLLLSALPGPAAAAVSAKTPTLAAAHSVRLAKAMLSVWFFSDTFGELNAVLAGATDDAEGSGDTSGLVGFATEVLTEPGKWNPQFVADAASLAASLHAGGDVGQALGQVCEQSNTVRSARVERKLPMPTLAEPGLGPGGREI